MSGLVGQRHARATCSRVQVAEDLIDPSFELAVPLPVALTVSSDALVHTTNAWTSEAFEGFCGEGIEHDDSPSVRAGVVQRPSPEASEMAKESGDGHLFSMELTGTGHKTAPVAKSDP